MNKQKCKQYRDTWAAPGSQLYEALDAKDMKKAERLYQDLEVSRLALQYGVTEAQVRKDLEIAKKLPKAERLAFLYGAEVVGYGPVANPAPVVNMKGLA